ncbi:hypothetical protein CSA08_01405 [Candidatus Gracilibacteria bacterium]|nr:MAG: hypothetical protein CSA08_01405 [Candidatus Gracilibacteria bacterium]
MTNNFIDNIIVPAWEIVHRDSKIKKFYFFPGLLSIIFLTFLLVYQVIYTYVEVFGKKEEAFVIILDFFHSDYIFEAIISLVVFLIVYLLISPIFEGALIRYIDNKKSGENHSYSEIFGSGMYRFFPLFEYNNIFSEFKFISILNGYLFIIRFIGIEYIKELSIIFGVILFLSIILNSLFAYSKYEIVLGNKKTFEAAGSSSKIAILNIGMTLKIYFLMFIFNIRVIINFVIFLSFPLLFVTILGFITSTIFLTIALIILSIVFLFFIFALGYLTAVLEVFKASVWYFAYMQGRKRLEKEEHINLDK